MFSGSSFHTSYGYLSHTFGELFRCYPISMMHERIRKDEADFGGKIFLPPSALSKLSMLNISFPMLFELSVNETGNFTHAGVLEFTAEEGRAYLPNWMFDTLKIQPGALLTVRSTDLPLGEFVKLEPQSIDFLDISDPKAVLENVLRNFSTLTVGDIIEIRYNKKTYAIKILEVRPANDSRSICVVETDLVTDFAPPIGYIEKQNRPKKRKNKVTFDAAIMNEGSMSVRIDYAGKIKNPNSATSNFIGEGKRLSGKNIDFENRGNSSVSKDLRQPLNRDPLHLSLPYGQLFFGFEIVPPKLDDCNDSDTKIEQFIGKGNSLRNSSKRKVKQDHDSLKQKASKSPEIVEID